MTHPYVSEIIMNTKVDEGKLISGKEALIALANGEEVEACVTTRLIESEWHWFNSKNLSVFEIESQETEGLPDGSEIRKIVFRLKPRTISINGIEVPSVRYIAHSGGNCVKISCHCPEDARVINAALRQVFGGSHDN